MSRIGHRQRDVIVHADDLGYSDTINRGIVRAHSEGVVTSTAFMANMPGAETGARLAIKHPTLETGLHLNLTEGQPLTDAATLRGPDGNFRGLGSQILALTTGRVRTKEIEAEARAQWDRMLAMGLPIAHINGHQHIHLFGDALFVTLALARQARIPVRRPVEQLWRNLGGSVTYFGRRIVLRWASARGNWDGVVFPHQFLELTGPRHGRSAAWLTDQLLAREGLVEVLCHPGEVDVSAEEPLRERRVEELSILTAPGLRAHWADLGIVLRTHTQVFRIHSA